MSRNMVYKAVICLACALTMAGCETGRVFKTFEIGGEEGVSVSRDASQSAIINHDPDWSTRQGSVAPYRIVCTEPSPDVATVLAQSVAGGGKFADKVAAEFASSSKEGLVQLAERTVAVQVLRERMFRACEAYSNGAITGTTYTLLMNRFDRAMVTVLFGEVMGGAFGRSLAAIGSINEAAEELVRLEKKLDDAQKRLEEAGDEQNIKKLTVVRDQAKTKRDAMRDLLHDLGSTVIAAGPIEAKAEPETHAFMAEIFKDFIKSHPLDDYIAACIVELERGLSTSPLKKPFDAYRQRLLDKLKDVPFRDNHQQTLAAIEGIDRRTALFEHCRSRNLLAVAEMRQREIVSFRSYEMGLKKAELLIREQEARNGATESYENAMEQCDRINEESVRDKCFATVQAMQIKYPDTVIPLLRDIPLPPSLMSSIDIQPTVMFERLKQRIPRLTRSKEQLAKREPLQIQDCDCGKEEKCQTNKRLNDERGALLEESQELLDRAEREISLSKQQELQELEHTRTDLLSKRQNATTDHEIEFYLLKLQLQSMEAKIEFNKYENILDEVETMIRKLKRHHEKMNEETEPPIREC